MRNEKNLFHRYKEIEYTFDPFFLIYLLKTIRNPRMKNYLDVCKGFRTLKLSEVYVAL